MDSSLSLKLAALKSWLGVGSINLFGLPMSGKDTVGTKLAEALGAQFLSSGAIIREREQAERQQLTAHGELIKTDIFYDWVLPVFDSPDLKSLPLVLSSIGRWSGEEDEVMARAKSSGHELKAAIVLNVSEADVMNRWETAQALGDRGARADDADPEVFKTRLAEFREKTLPVLKHYHDLGLLVEVKADVSREEVFANLVDALYAFSLQSQPSSAS